MTLHIYGQLWQHDNAYIVGTEDDLKKLADSICAAIEKGHPCSDFFTADGEGFSTYVSSKGEELMGQVKLPYHDVDSEDTRSNVIEPWQIALYPSHFS